MQDQPLSGGRGGAESAPPWPWFSLALAAAVAGCGDGLDRDGACHGSSAPAPYAVGLEPGALAEGVPAVLRLRAHPEGGRPLAAEGLVLVRGEVASSHLGQLARGEVSASLTERLVPVLRWLEPGGAVVVAPQAPLEPGASYALASGQPRSSWPFTVALDDPLPLMRRVWPPEGRSASDTTAVWCAEGLAGLVTMPATLEPRAVPGRLEPGAATGGAGAHCGRFVADAPAATVEPRLPPLTWDGEGDPRARLDPRPLRIDEPPVELVALPCEPGEVAFGPGCAQIGDDRLVLRTPEQPLLWVVRGHAPATPGFEWVAAGGAGQVMLVHGLPAETAVRLEVVVVTTGGVEHAAEVHVTTLPAMGHVVLTEVLADPVGVEPQQEWIELYNDGLAPAWLGGLRLQDVGGSTDLPPVVLPAGGYALLVREDYDETDDLDVAPAPGSLLLRVPKIGNGSLNNQGEPLKLLDGLGAVLSRFPAAPRPRSGRSVQRVHPRAPDGEPGSFVLSDPAPTPGAPNGPGV